MKQEEINKMLLDAVFDENVSLKDVKALISAGADVNYQNDWGQTCFDRACRKGNAEIAKLLLQDERFDVSKVFDECLHMACFMGQDKLVKAMLEDGRFDVNKKNQNGQTPLMCACEKDRADVVKLLLQDEKIDINKEDDWERTCFDMACRKGNAEIAKLLLQDEWFDVSKVFDECLHKACFMGQDKLVKAMLEDGRFDVNKKNQNGQTPLMCACEKGRADVVKLLLQDERTKVDVMDNEGKMALEYSNDMEIVGLFRKAAVKKGVEENKDKYISNKEKIKDLKARISGEPKMKKSDEHKRNQEVSFVVSMKSNNVNDK
ncbi:MAG: ankyrin repeat domain-containing protein [Alphaproteobacteria bacterium]|nr:ankyrin repeat domain-containing protein [Alphaproteobacteria bacterium]